MLKFAKPCSQPALVCGLLFFAANLNVSAGLRDRVRTQTTGETFQISETGPPGNTDIDAFQPTVAYNTVQNEFLVAWHGETSPGVFEVFFTRLGPTGQRLGLQVQLTSDARPSLANAFPEVVFNPDRNEYLMVWNKQDPSGELENQLFFTLLNAAGATLFPNYLQLTTQLEFENGPSRAFQRHAVYNPDDREYLVVWAGEVARGEFEILAQRIDADTGFPVGPDDAVVTATGADGDPVTFATAPRVAYNHVEKEYFVVFDANPEIFDVEVYGVSVDPRLKTRASSAVKISSAGPDGDPSLGSFFPDLAFNPDLNEYFVAWEAERIDAEFEIFGRMVDGATGLPKGAVFPISDAGPPFQSEFDAFSPRVSLGGEAYLVVWEGEDSLENKFEIHGQLIDRALGSEVGVDDFQISRTFPEFTTETGASSAALAYSPTAHDFLVAWNADGVNAGEFEIFGSLVGGSPQAASARFAPDLTVEVQSTDGTPLSGNQRVRIRRSSSVFLDQPELPLSRILRLDKGFLDLDGLTVGDVPIETTADLRANIAGQRMSIASARILYVVAEKSGSEARLRGVISEMNVSPIVLALVPTEFSNIAQQLVGFRLVEATLSREPFGGGFVLTERFNTGDRVSPDYQGFGTVLTTVDTFGANFFRTFPGQHLLRAASDFVSRRERLSAGVFLSDFQVAGAPGPSIEADQNPVQVCSGRVGRTTIRWTAPGSAEVRVGSPEGNVLTSGSDFGEAETGDWVTDGLEFYLVSSITGEVWSRVKVLHTSVGCPLPDRFSFAQFGDGEGLSSRILLIADSRVSETPVELDFTDPVGAPLALRINGQEVEGTLRKTLPPGGLLLLSTAGAGPLVRGSVGVASELALSGVLLFEGPFGFAGVGASPGSSDGFVSPVETDPAGINTGLAVKNLEESRVTLSLVLRSSQGTELARSQLPLDASGQVAMFVDELPWNPTVDLTRLVGSIEVEAGPKVAAVAIQTRPGEFATLPTSPLVLLGPAQQPAEVELFFAHFADGLGEIFTQILLLNPSSRDTTATLALRDTSGAPATLTLNGQSVTGGMDVRIPARSLVILESDSTSDPLIQGSVRVSSPTPVSGAVLFGGRAGVAGVGASSPGSAFAAPVTLSSMESFDMGVAVANVTDAPAELQLSLKDVNGAVVAKSSAALPPHGQLARFIGEFSWSPGINVTDFVGVVEVKASRGVVATALLTRPGQFATLPVSVCEGN